MIVQQRVVLLLLGLWSSVFKGELRGTAAVWCGPVRCGDHHHSVTPEHNSLFWKNSKNVEIH